MTRRILLLVALLCAGAARPATAQVAGSMRLQRLVSALHTPVLRVADSRGRAVPLLVDLHSLVRGREPAIRQQLRLPVSDRADFMLTGRIGRFGPSSQARFRFRF
jgi:hypothetical protein